MMNSSALWSASAAEDSGAAVHGVHSASGATLGRGPRWRPFAVNSSVTPLAGERGRRLPWRPQLGGVDGSRRRHGLREAGCT
jgi:hypothetical protein